MYMYCTCNYSSLSVHVHVCVSSLQIFGVNILLDERGLTIYLPMFILHNKKGRVVRRTFVDETFCSQYIVYGTRNIRLCVCDRLHPENSCCFTQHVFKVKNSSYQPVLGLLHYNYEKNVIPAGCQVGKTDAKYYCKVLYYTSSL